MAIPLYSRSMPDADQSDATEWLLSAGNGSFAMGTISGVASRRYHGLLIASTRPPVNRVMTLNALAETVVISDGNGSRRVELWRARFRPGDVHPRDAAPIEQFEKDVTCRWVYDLGGGLRIRKHVALARGTNLVAVSYRLEAPATPGLSVRIELRPLVTMRDFHSLSLKETAREQVRIDDREGVVSVQAALATLFMRAKGTTATREEQWWYNFQLNQERDRGYDFLEDALCPCVFHGPLAPGQTLTFWASTDVAQMANQPDPEAMRREETSRVESIVTRSRENVPAGSAAFLTKAVEALAVAGDDFVVRRVVTRGLPGAVPVTRATIIAGYPWFADWGRDSMISLPGLLLLTGRFEEAREVLRTFATARRNGLVPNLFDDYSGDAHYNTADASLWFIHAACEYLRLSGDRSTFFGELLPAARDIIEHALRGTDFGIRVDPADGLLVAGNEQTQLTWMDAKRDGVVFTPRYGKPVEINALWYHALRSLVEACATPVTSGTSVIPGASTVAGIARTVTGALIGVVRPSASGVASAPAAPSAEDVVFIATLAGMADRAGSSLRTRFWNTSAGCLYDVLSPTHDGWRPHPEIRPNQLLAVSLRHSALSIEQQQGVVEVCRRELLTRHGVRTLWRADGRYRGRFRGRMFDRDAAYHNGTAWPWLTGPMVEAILRAGQCSPASCEDAEHALRPMLESLDTQCLGQIAEVFDGDDDPPMVQQPGGCPAQAWSVAEALRGAVLIAQARKGKTI
jgi:predicted glycogen debranching enzyme